MDFIKQFSVVNEPGSQVTISGEIPFTELETERGKAIAHLGRNLKIDGFRPGHVPDKVIIEKLGEMAILSEMAERAIARVYPAAVRELKIDAIGYPAITITKIALGNPLGFTAKVAVLPSITLPDYTAIASKLNTDKTDATVTDEDVTATIKDMMRQKRAYDRLQAKASSVDLAHDEHEHHDHDHSHDHVDHHHHDHGDVTDLPTPETVTKEEEVEPEFNLADLTDDYVKTLGKFESVEDFKTTIRTHLTTEREREAAAAHRAKLTDAIIEASTLELPTILVDSELDQMAAQMREELERANLRFEDYLKHINKTEEDLRTDWKPAAEKRAKLQLVLNEIAKVAKVSVDEEATTEQVAELMERFPDADRERVRIYVHSILQNEAVMKLLESASK